jgi:Uma2 family endonuclease
MQVQLRQTIVPPGQQLLMTDISWLMYEQLLEELGEKRSSRINYSEGVLEIMVPLPEHEFDKGIISYLVIALLEELDIDFITLGSTTFKSELMKQGLEADDCFYIENEAVIRGKKRIDLTVDPPPDLALEIDITSRTRLNNYEVLGVKELWRFNGTQLEINVLESGKYIQVNESPHFPSFPLHELIPQYIERNKIDGRNKTMKAFRTWVKERVIS